MTSRCPGAVPRRVRRFRANGLHRVTRKQQVAKPYARIRRCVPGCEIIDHKTAKIAVVSIVLLFLVPFASTAASGADDPRRTETEEYVGNGAPYVTLCADDSPYAYLNPTDRNIAAACFDVEPGDASVEFTVRDASGFPVTALWGFRDSTGDLIVSSTDNGCVGSRTVAVPSGADTFEVRLSMAPLAPFDCTPPGDLGLAGTTGNVTAHFD